jgi:hypothetical protein
MTDIVVLVGIISREALPPEWLRRRQIPLPLKSYHSSNHKSSGVSLRFAHRHLLKICGEQYAAFLTSLNVRPALQALNCLQRLMLDARVCMSGGGLKRIPYAPVADFPQCLNCRFNNVSVIGLPNERNQCCDGFAFMSFAQNPCGAHLCGAFWIAQRGDVFVNVIRLRLLCVNIVAAHGADFCRVIHH